jgi:hypothetical protein
VDFSRMQFLAMVMGAQVMGAQFPNPFPPPMPERDPRPKRLPDGTLQSEAILKAEHKKMMEDVTKIQELAKEVEAELEKNQHHVLSTGLLKKLEEIEKLAKRMRSRHNR